MFETASITPDNANYESSFTIDSSSPSRSEEDQILLDQVERILHSEELRGSEVLRRLLRFLATKSVSGEADSLKEYSVAIDGLGKPSAYDPRHNSAVRIQVGRLRQKLTDYYRREGEHDPILIDIPKGRFKLKFELRNKPESIDPSPVLDDVAIAMTSPEPSRSLRRLKGFQFAASVTAGILLALAAGAIYNAIKPTRAKATQVAYTASWNPEMEDLWQPFMATDRPMIVAIEDPLFVELDGKTGIYYRDRTLNTWDAITSSPSIGSLRSALKTHEMAPSHYYTAFGEVDASFLLAKTLGSRVPNLIVVKTSDLSMREFAENNVVFVGLANLFFNDQIQAVPVDIPLQQISDGIRNLHPGPNEPAQFLDNYSTAPREEGTAYALVTSVPGPLGDNEVESFTCSRAAGYVAAVKAFTDPSFVHFLVGRLKQTGGGKMPRYYQVLLKVKFTDEVPTEITYVLSKELHYTHRS